MAGAVVRVKAATPREPTSWNTGMYLYLGGVLHVGRTRGLEAGHQAPEARLSVDLGIIKPLDPDSHDVRKIK